MNPGTYRWVADIPGDILAMVPNVCVLIRAKVKRYLLPTLTLKPIMLVECPRLDHAAWALKVTGAVCKETVCELSK